MTVLRKRARKKTPKRQNTPAETIETVPRGGLFVYGVGDHLKDMLEWFPDLEDRIVRIFDKNKDKIGKRAPGLQIDIESPQKLKDLPTGTVVAISALRYYDEIVTELHKLNPGLLCPDIDKAYRAAAVAERLPEGRGILSYGVGEHLADMLDWHPELADRIVRVFDTNTKRAGKQAPGLDRTIEEPEKLKRLPAGTIIAIAAIRYFDDIAKKIYALNPGLVCQNIDITYAMLPPVKKKDKPKETTQTNVTFSGFSDEQRQCLRGMKAAARWRQNFLMNCGSVQHVFWGAKGMRSAFLQRAFQPMMHDGDIFIDDDQSLRGQMKNGLPICAPEALKDIAGKFVIIVMNDYPQVRERLISYGYIENVDFVEGRMLLGEDEHGALDVPCIDKRTKGMIVYGSGAHLQDMVKWHGEIAWHISHIIDKDASKIGQIDIATGVIIEPPSVLQDLPTGTEVAVSAIRYLDEITKDIHTWQPGIVCRSIDEIWQEYV